MENALNAATPVVSDAEAVATVRRSGIRSLRVEVPALEGAETPKVEIRLYSLSGRLVRVLFREQLDPGYYVVGWDAQDDAGRAVAPGVYIAIMTAGSFRGVQRLIIK